jgi:hypothetical protein
MGERRNSYNILVGRHRHRWEDNIGMDLWKIVWELMNWMHLAQDSYQWRSLVNTVMNLRIPYKAGNFLIN